MTLLAWNMEEQNCEPRNMVNLKRQRNRSSPRASRKDTFILTQWGSCQSSDLHVIRTSEPVESFCKSLFKPNWWHMLGEKDLNHSHTLGVFLFYFKIIFSPFVNLEFTFVCCIMWKTNFIFPKLTTNCSETLSWKMPSFSQTGIRQRLACILDSLLVHPVVLLPLCLNLSSELLHLYSKLMSGKWTPYLSNEHYRHYV